MYEYYAMDKISAVGDFPMQKPLKLAVESNRPEKLIILPCSNHDIVNRQKHCARSLSLLDESFRKTKTTQNNTSVLDDLYSSSGESEDEFEENGQNRNDKSQQKPSKLTPKFIKQIENFYAVFTKTKIRLPGTNKKVALDDYLVGKKANPNIPEDLKQYFCKIWYHLKLFKNDPNRVENAIFDEEEMDKLMEAFKYLMPDRNQSKIRWHKFADQIRSIIAYYPTFRYMDGQFGSKIMKVIPDEELLKAYHHVEVFAAKEKLFYEETDNIQFGAKFMFLSLGLEHVLCDSTINTSSTKMLIAKGNLLNKQ